MRDAITGLIPIDIQMDINNYFYDKPIREYTKFDYLFLINEAPAHYLVETEKTFDVKLQNGKTYVLDKTNKVLFKENYSFENWNKKSDNDIAEIICNAINNISKKISDLFPPILMSKKYIPIFYNSNSLRTVEFVYGKKYDRCRILDPVVGFPLDLTIMQHEASIELIISVIYDFIKPE